MASGTEETSLIQPRGTNAGITLYRPKSQIFFQGPLAHKRVKKPRRNSPAKLNLRPNWSKYKGIAKLLNQSCFNPIQTQLRQSSFLWRKTTHRGSLKAGRAVKILSFHESTSQPVSPTTNRQPVPFATSSARRWSQPPRMSSPAAIMISFRCTPNPCESPTAI